MASIFEDCPKQKQKAKAFGFHSFLGPGSEVHFCESFRNNVRVFLRECGDREDYTVEGMPIWSTLLVDEKRGVVIPLYVVEESVMCSSNPFCDQCRFVGWSHHFVSRLRYHMIIPADEDWDKPLSDIFYVQNHLLHGLIHCNGFGHLLWINGHEGGSQYATGTDLMDLWDRICTTLRAREVTLEDRSRNSSMELRLLYAAAYGQPWFGRWGYKFCHGTFGVTADMYTNAVQILGSLTLDAVMDNFGKTGKNRDIRRIVGCYQKMSKSQLKTLQDLLRFMLEFKARLQHGNKKTTESLKPSSTAANDHQPNSKTRNKYRQFSKMASSLTSRWPARRVEYTAQVIVDALKEKAATSCNKAAWMTRQEVRDAARLHIGDTGLIDFVVKSLGGCTVGNQLIIRAVNPTTRVGEYMVRGLDSEPPAKADSDIIWDEINQDLVQLYKQVLEDYPQGAPSSEKVKLAARVILNSTHFIKKWPFRDNDDELLRYWVVPVAAAGEEEGQQWVSPPPELVVVSLYATVGELKAAGERALRDSYCSLERFEVSWIEGVHLDDDDDVLFGVLESGSHVRLRGSRLDTCELMYEGGSDCTWRVDCSCGARDDDGERMVACDMCEVWQHTICEGIDDSDVVPPLFLCGRCRYALQQSSEQSLLTVVGGRST